MFLEHILTGGVINRSRGISVGLVTVLRAGRSGVRFPAQARDVSVGLNQLFVQSEPESLFAGMKRLGLTFDLPPTYIGEVKNERTCTFFSVMCLHGLYRDTFTLTITH